MNFTPMIEDVNRNTASIDVKDMPNFVRHRKHSR